MKNKIADLNNHLFAALERLGDEDLVQEEIAEEHRRAMAIVAIAEKVIEVARLRIDTVIAVKEHGLDAGASAYLELPAPSTGGVIGTVSQDDAQQECQD
jgi:hypothetical protein